MFNTYTLKIEDLARNILKIFEQGNGQNIEITIYSESANSD